MFDKKLFINNCKNSCVMLHWLSQHSFIQLEEVKQTIQSSIMIKNRTHYRINETWSHYFVPMEIHRVEIYCKFDSKITLQIYKCLSNEAFPSLTWNLGLVASLLGKHRLRLAKSKDVVANEHELISLGLSMFSVSGFRFQKKHASQVEVSNFNKISLSNSKNPPVHWISPLTSL